MIGFHTNIDAHVEKMELIFWTFRRRWLVCRIWGYISIDREGYADG